MSTKAWVGHREMSLKAKHTRIHRGYTMCTCVNIPHLLLEHQDSHQLRVLFQYLDGVAQERLLFSPPAIGSSHVQDLLHLSRMAFFNSSRPSLANSTMFFSLSPPMPVVCSTVVTPSSLATASATKSLPHRRQRSLLSRVVEWT